MKLWSVGITDKLWTWFQSYLSNHSQFALIDNCSSDSLPVKSSVPQESILGPLYCLSYINDLLPSIMHSYLFKFADHVKCYKAIHNFQNSQSLQLDVDSLFQWSLDNKLSFNYIYINNRELSKVTLRTL